MPIRSRERLDWSYPAGAYGEAMNRLRAAVWCPLRDRSPRTAHAICLGLQIFGTGSDESPGVSGLGCVSAMTTGFDVMLTSPQMGWNRVTPTGDAVLCESGYAYFANSFRFERIPAGWAGATANYGGPMVAALERGAVLGCQFHPGSVVYGEGLLARRMEAEPC